MVKIPCMDLKSRKWTMNGNRITKLKKKLFCPRIMVRYDTPHDEYPTKWVCKMCLKCLLSKNAAKKHLTNCSGQPIQASLIIPTTKNEESSYICNFCNKVFTRRATLNKHLEEHEKSSSQLDSDLSGNEVEDRSIQTENASDDSNDSDDSDDSDASDDSDDSDDCDESED